MAKRIGLIFGASGQDGTYLSELLLSKGYIVYGVVRRNSADKYPNIEHIRAKLKLIYGDLTDGVSIFSVFGTIFSTEGAFDKLEVYNLGAMSHVKISFDIPLYTSDVDALGTLRILEAILKSGHKDKIRLYQASTSELYGRVLATPQTETTPFNPVSPYACAKLYGFYIVRQYRESYNMFAANGIVFNHTSIRRGHNFVCRKITRAVAAIYHKTQDCLYLGNLNSRRDIGHAADHVQAMWLMLQAPTPQDYVVSTNETYSIRQLVEMAFAVLFKENLSWEGKDLDEVGKIGEQVVVRVDPQFFRPNEVDLLLGDSAKIERELGWKAKYTVTEIFREMVLFDLARIQNGQD